MEGYNGRTEDLRHSRKHSDNTTCEANVTSTNLIGYRLTGYTGNTGRGSRRTHTVRSSRTDKAAVRMVAYKVGSKVDTACCI